MVIDRPIIYGVNGLLLNTGTGYGEAGASFKKRALKGFSATSSGAVLDIDAHNATLRQRARMLYMASPIATSAIRTNRTNVIGCGLRLKSRINRAVLGLDAKAATELEKRIESEFDLWASDKRACDATGINDFYSVQQLVFLSWLLSGDAFVLFKQGGTDVMNPYALRLHVIEADRICTPPSGMRGWKNGVISVDGIPVSYHLGFTEGTAANGNRIHDGVEVDQNGAIAAYYICSEYPVGLLSAEKPTWTRVTAYGEETGLLYKSWTWNVQTSTAACRIWHRSLSRCCNLADIPRVN